MTRDSDSGASAGARSDDGPQGGRGASPDPRREALAEALSWACFDWTRYSETAHEDHNRWSWRGDGHGAPDEAARTPAARGWVYEAADEILTAFPHLALDGRTVRGEASVLWCLRCERQAGDRCAELHPLTVKGTTTPGNSADQEAGE